jgi:hypothetical protein
MEITNNVLKIFNNEVSREIDFSNMENLEKLLIKNNIPYIKRKIYDGYQILYPDIKQCKCSIVCHYASYGGKNGLLEIYGLLNDEEKREDDVVGHLDYLNVFERIKKDYEA